MYYINERSDYNISKYETEAAIFSENRCMLLMLYFVVKNVDFFLSLNVLS